MHTYIKTTAKKKPKFQEFIKSYIENKNTAEFTKFRYIEAAVVSIEEEEAARML